MAESFENLDNILHDWAKGKYKKKYCQGIEQVREAWSSRKKKDKVISFLENGSGKIFEQSVAVERDKPNTKLVLVS